MSTTKQIVRLGAVAGTVLATSAAFAVSANAAADRQPFFGGSHAVFVQTDDPAGNQIVAYHRDADGTLTPAGTYATGGLGGVLTGAVVDHLGSQDSLTYDARHGLLYAVNAGSDTVTVFAVHGDALTLRQVVGSGGEFPVSVAVHGDVVYVLNALNGGAVQGYLVVGGRLAEVPAWHRGLGLDPTATPQFTHTPGQVGFSADGTRLIVTTKANGNDIDVFRLGLFGGIEGAPVVNSEPGAVPFAFVVGGAGRLVVAEAGPNAVATFRLNGDGTLTNVSTADTGQAGTCWIASADGRYYASNAGSATLSGYADQGGELTQLAAGAVTPTDAGTVDAAASIGGHYLYVETGAHGALDDFAVGTDGSLTKVGSESIPAPTGGQGIVAF